MKFNKPRHIYKELKKTDFSDFQKSILIGSILGDGYLEKRSTLRDALFREEHAMDQVEWLKWKYNNLKPFTTSNMWSRNRGNRIMMPDGHRVKKLYKIQEVCAMSTGIHPYLTILHSHFYKDKVKIIPKEFLIDNFNIVALSVLIGDDGNFCENNLRICTDNFSENEVYFLADMFSNFFDGRITVREEKPNKFRVVFTRITRDLKFFDSCRNILPRCMHHKVSPVLNEHQAATLYE